MKKLKEVKTVWTIESGGEVRTFTDYLEIIKALADMSGKTFTLSETQEPIYEKREVYTEKILEGDVEIINVLGNSKLRMREHVTVKTRWGNISGVFTEAEISGDHGKQTVTLSIDKVGNGR